MMDYRELEERLESMPGNISFYYRNLATGEEFSYRDGEKLMAASVIKLYVMAAAFARIADGRLDPEQMIVTGRADFVPSCGAVAYLHEGLQVTVLDLITLMIIFSDNTATNILIDLIGIDEINEEIRRLGFRDTWLRRKMFDAEKSRRGIQNLITAGDSQGSAIKRKDSVLFESACRGAGYCPQDR